MSLGRRLLAGLGVVLAIAGFAVAVDRGLAATLTLGEVLLIPVGLVALVQGYRTLKDRRRATFAAADPGDPETEQDLPTPGDGFDDRLRSLSPGAATPHGAGGRAGRNHAVRTRDAIEERVESAAVATLRRRLGCTEADARELLRTGDWTDDPVAAAFFTGELEGVSRRRRLRLLLSGEPTFHRRARRAADAVADLSAGAPVPDRARRRIAGGDAPVAPREVAA